MGIACSCETQTNTSAKVQKPQEERAPVVVKKSQNSNDFFGKGGYVSISSDQLSKCKEDAGSMNRVLFLFLGRLSCSNCRSMQPIFDREIAENSHSLISLKIDCDNSPDVVSDDIPDGNNSLPFIKAYRNGNFIGASLGFDEDGFKRLVSKALGRSHPEPARQQNEDIEISVKEEYVVEEKVDVQVFVDNEIFEFEGGKVINVSSKKEYNQYVTESGDGNPFLLFFFKKNQRLSYDLFQMFKQYSEIHGKRLLFGKADVEKVDYFEDALSGQVISQEFPIIISHNFGEFSEIIYGADAREGFDGIIQGSLTAADTK